MGVKKHIQIKDSYTAWNPSLMRYAVELMSQHLGYGSAKTTKAHIVEWWLHNIFYYITKPFVAFGPIKALNQRSRDVDLLVEVEHDAEEN